MTVQKESSTALGQGLRLGFLGTLHMDVFRQRLEDEYDANILITSPTVPYKGLPLNFSSMCLTRDPSNSPLAVIYREKGTDRTVVVSNPTDFPDITDAASKVKQVQEPVVKASIIVPEGADYSELITVHH